MSGENNSLRDQKDANQNTTNSQQERIGDTVQRKVDNTSTQENKQSSNAHPKPSVPVRLWRTLLRRRVWRQLAGHPRANWAEMVTVCITSAIVIVGSIQAYIYWKQDVVMESSLNQNERMAILMRGQLAVAIRSVETTQQQLKAFERAESAYIGVGQYQGDIKHSVINNAA